MCLQQLVLPRALPVPALSLLPCWRQVGVPASEAWRLGCSLRGADGYVDYPVLFRGLHGPGTCPRRDRWSALAGRPASTPLCAAPAPLADAKPCAGSLAAPGRLWLPWESVSGACEVERQSCSGAQEACTAAANGPSAAPSACLAQGGKEGLLPDIVRADDAWADAAVVRAAAVAAASAAGRQGDMACAQGQGRPATACGAAPPRRQGAGQPSQRPQSAAAGVSGRQAAFERARYDAAARAPAAPRQETVRGGHAPYWFSLAAPGREEAASAAAWRLLGDASQFRTCFSRARPEHRPQFLVCAGRGLPAETPTTMAAALLRRPASALACALRQAAADVGRGAAAHTARVSEAGRARPHSALGDVRRGSADLAAGPGTAARQAPGSAAGWDDRRRPPSRGRAVTAQSAEGALPRAMVPAALPVGRGRAADAREGRALAQDMLVVRALAWT